MKKVHINYVLDAVIALAFIVSAASGFVLLFLGEGGRNSGFSNVMLGISRASWHELHVLGSLIMIAGVLMHVALHWKWIVCATKLLVPQFSHTKEEVCEVIA